jgi:CDP-glycerol glycerophosphotransferase (TagB/SpsB family)
MDLLITDYSSIYFDYLLLNRPIIFTPTDLEEYRETRGFLLEPYDFWTPGPKVTSQKALQHEILKSLCDIKYFQSERETILSIIHQYRDNKSSERLWNMIDRILEGEEDY